MKVHPAIAALRSDRASQRCAQVAMTDAHTKILELEPVRQISADLGAYADGAKFSSLPALSSILTDLGRARQLVELFTSHFSAALRDQPLGEVPLRHSYNPGFSRLQLMQRGGAVLSLCAYEPTLDQIVPTSAQFVDCEMRELIVSGAASGFVQELSHVPGGRAKVSSSRWSWRAGDGIERLPLIHSRQFVAVEQTLLVLQLTLTPTAPEPTCNYRLEDGALEGQSSGNRKASEQVMALGVLGALGIPETISPMIDFALDAFNDPDARWEGVRQVLALDAARGFALLDQLATVSRDPLAHPANALRQQLLATQPALATRVCHSELETG